MPYDKALRRLIELPEATDVEWAEAALAGYKVMPWKTDGHDHRYPWRAYRPDASLLNVFFTEREAWMACWANLNGVRRRSNEWDLDDLSVKRDR